MNNKVKAFGLIIFVCLVLFSSCSFLSLQRQTADASIGFNLAQSRATLDLSLNPKLVVTCSTSTTTETKTIAIAESTQETIQITFKQIPINTTVTITAKIIASQPLNGQTAEVELYFGSATQKITDSENNISIVLKKVSSNYTVTYNANGATGDVPDIQTGIRGLPLTIAQNSGNLQKEGFAFVGWNTKVDGSGTSYIANVSYFVDTDVTLYAQWTTGIVCTASNVASTISGLAAGSHNIVVTGLITNDTISAIRLALRGNINAKVNLNFLYTQGVTSLGYNAFQGCTTLTSIAIPSSVTSIGEHTFGDCTSLATVTFSEGLVSIGINPFGGCEALTTISIPSTVTSIGFRAFDGCTSLASITIPSSVTSIGDSVFSGCTSLTSITVDSANTTYKSVDGVLLTKDGLTLICFPARKNATSYEIPSGVTSLGYNAFQGCTSLTSIAIPSSVTSIGEHTFGDCTSLATVTFSEGLVSIGRNPFGGCEALTNITIPSTVTSIGCGAFDGCNALTSIVFTDTTPWYKTTSESDWTSRTNGTETAVTDSTTNAANFKLWDYYWYTL